MPLTDEQRAAVRERVEANIARIRDENYPIQLAKYREMKARRDVRRTAQTAGPSQRRGSKDPLHSWNARKEPSKKVQTIEKGDSDDEDEPTTTDYVGFGHEISTQEAYRVPSKRPSALKRSEMPMIHKRPRNSVSMAWKSEMSGSSASPASASTAVSQRALPEWYQKITAPKSRGRDQANVDGALDRLKEEIRKLKKLQRPLANDFMLVRDYLHSVVFLQVDGKLLRAKRMLHSEDGLPQIFDPAFSGAVPWPWDVKADAEELYNKWYHGDFDTDIYRGIVRGKPAKKGKSKEASSSAVDKLADDAGRYRLMDTHAHGNGKLLNGQWWPTQLAALRDGAHGATIAGITGKEGEGTFSVVLSGGNDPSGAPYPNIDNGDEVQYCGTDSDNGHPALGTKRLLESERNKQPVRLIRSSNLKSPYAPELGFRYDGLYTVTGFERLDPESSKRQRHRFTMIRVPGQDPLRGEGAEKRPTAREIEAYKKDRVNSGR